MHFREEGGSIVPVLFIGERYILSPLRRLCTWSKSNNLIYTGLFLDLVCGGFFAYESFFLSFIGHHHTALATPA